MFYLYVGTLKSNFLYLRQVLVTVKIVLDNLQDKNMQAKKKNQLIQNLFILSILHIDTLRAINIYVEINFHIFNVFICKDISNDCVHKFGEGS